MKCFIFRMMSSWKKHLCLNGLCFSFNKKCWKGMIWSSGRETKYMRKWKARKSYFVWWALVIHYSFILGRGKKFPSIFYLPQSSCQAHTFSVRELFPFYLSVYLYWMVCNIVDADYQFNTSHIYHHHTNNEVVHDNVSATIILGCGSVIGRRPQT